jgi:hypothetical protein
MSETPILNQPSALMIVEATSLRANSNVAAPRICERHLERISASRFEQAGTANADVSYSRTFYCCRAETGFWRVLG